MMDGVGELIRLRIDDWQKRGYHLGGFFKMIFRRLRKSAIVLNQKITTKTQRI